MYKEGEVTSPKKIDHTKITFDFLNDNKISLTLDKREVVRQSWGGLDATQCARFTSTQVQIGLATKYEDDKVSI